MARLLNIGMVFAIIGGAALTYGSKHDIEEASAGVARLRLELAREKDALSLLRAEWSVLTQPSRLQELIVTYNDQLGLEPFEPNRLVAIDDIPLRPPSVVPRTTSTAMSGGPTIDSLITGSVP